MRKFQVTGDGPLQAFLFEVLADTKKTRVRQFLKHGGVSVNGKAVTRHDHPLKSGDEVCVQTSRDDRPPAPGLGVRILHEDPFLIVCEKPSGLLTIATDKEKRNDALYAVNAYVNGGGGARGGERSAFAKKIFVVHRLDRGASGALIFARNFEIKEKLQKNWERYRKRYYAVVEGTPERESGEIRSYLREEKTLRVSVGPERAGAKLAVTRYRVVRSGGGYAHVEIELVTGRKHQIRAQFASLGHPIAGDRDYGSVTNPAGRLALHACEISFEHPVSGERLVIKSPVPSLLTRIA